MLIKNVLRTEFVSNFKGFASWLILAQLITAAFIPALTRVYSPEKYATLALFMALVATVAPIVCGRYEQVIPISTTETEKHSAIKLCFFINWCFFLLAICSAFLAFTISDYIGWAGDINWTLGLAPFGLGLLGVLGILRNAGLSQGAYKLIGFGALAQALIAGVVSLALGLMNFGESGLLFGFVSGLLASVMVLFGHGKISTSVVFPKLRPADFKTAKKFAHFPLVNSFTSLLDCATLSMPVFFLASSYAGEVLGYYSLVLRAFNTPMNVVSQSVGQIALKRVADLVNGGGSPLPFFKKSVALLSFSGLIAAIIFVGVSKNGFGLIFGSKWSGAGVYAVILAPSLLIRFVVGTLSSLIIPAGHVKLVSIWQFFAFCSTGLVCLFFSGLADPESFLIALVVNDLIVYSIYFCVIFFAVCNVKRI